MDAIQSPKMPYINVTRNSFCVHDRNIQVLATVKSPDLVLLGNVLSDDECDALIAEVEPHLAPATVLGSAGGPIPSKYRTSKIAVIASETVSMINARLALIANWPIECADALQLQKYDIGDRYVWHHDWYDLNQPSAYAQTQNGGQRIGTFILYLSDVEEGGATAFRSLEIRPTKGNVVFFLNTDDQLNPLKENLHAGMPVIKGCKYIATRWLRESVVR